MANTYEGVWLINSKPMGETAGNPNLFHMEFGCSGSSAVSNLPLTEDNYKGFGHPAPWSLAKDAATGDIYFLDQSNSWKKVGV